MLKNLSVAAILLAAAIANAAEAPEAGQFDAPTLDGTNVPAVPSKSKGHKHSSSSSSSSSDSSSDSSSSTSSTSDSSTSTSSSSSGTSSSDSDSNSSSSSSSSTSSSDSDSEKKSKKSKVTGVKEFKKKYGKKWLSSFDKAKEHDIALIRHKSKVDSKGKKHKKARKSDVAFVKKSLNFKSKKPVLVTVNDNALKKGVVVKDDGNDLFKTKKTSYAVLDSGKHALTFAAAKKKVEGIASVKVEEIKLTSKLAKKYKVVSAHVKHSDAQELCERFNGELAEVKEGDIKKILKGAKKMVKAGITEVWIDRVVKSEGFSYLPTVLNLETGESRVDPDNLYSEVTEYATKKIDELPSKENKKKYKKAYEAAQKRIRAKMDDALSKKDNSVVRAVLCRV